MMNSLAQRKDILSRLLLKREFIKQEGMIYAL